MTVAERQELERLARSRAGGDHTRRGRRARCRAIEKYVSPLGAARYQEWLDGQRALVRGALPKAVRDAIGGAS